MESRQGALLTDKEAMPGRRPSTIALLGDSLCMPRPPYVGDIPLACTYPYLFHKSLMQEWGADTPYFIERGKRFRTIRDVANDWQEEVQFKQSDLVILHVGIVDCAPRVLSERERRLIERLRPRILQNKIQAFIHRHRRQIIRIRPPHVYVPLRSFKAHLRRIVERVNKAENVRLLIISILPPPASLDHHSPGLLENVAAYNEALRSAESPPVITRLDIKALFDASGDPVESLTVDGIHINRRGHELVAAALRRHILENDGGRR